MNITTLDQEIARTEQKIREYQDKVRTLRKRKAEEENALMIKFLRSSNLTIEDLKETFLSDDQKQDKEETLDV